MAYKCVARNIDEFLHQVTRLVGTGHYFFFSCLLGPDDDPAKLDWKIVNAWNLDLPYWKRAARHRGRAPSIHYLRFGSFYALLGTKGRGGGGEPHAFFTEYPVVDIRRYSMRCFGYSIRYPKSAKTGKRQLFVRLDDDAKAYLRTVLIRKATQPRFAERDAFEREVQSLPYQWYKPVRGQVKEIVREVNKIRRRAGLAQVRLSCVPQTMRVPRQFSSAAGVVGSSRIRERNRSGRKPERLVSAEKTVASIHQAEVQSLPSDLPR